MENATIIGLLLAGAAIAVAYVRLWPRWRDRVPHGWSVGPKVKGRNLSATVALRTTSDGCGFTFPMAGHSVHALLRGGLSLAGKRRLVLRYTVSAEPTVSFHAQENPSAPGEISLMLQRKGDDYTAKGEREFYRLYAPGPQFIQAGSHVLATDLSPQGWIGVFGVAPTQAQFDDVLNNLAAVHVCFGGGGSRAHGVFASGPAQFLIKE